MLIIDEDLKLNKKDNLSHRRFPFTLDHSFDKLIIKLSYAPRFVPSDEKENILAEAANIENFITTSLFYEREFVGAYHNKINDQEIMISHEFSSHGYKKFAIKPGAYEFVLSMHSCNSNVDAKISVEAIND